MSPFSRFLFTRLFSIPVTLLIVTAGLYGIVMLTPPEIRASLYLPQNMRSNMTEEQLQRLIDNIIKTHHLRDPFPIQYGVWLTNLAQGNWGYSPTLRDNVLASLLRRTPVTAELTLYSILAFIPLGLISGVVAGWRQNKPVDARFRLLAFISTSLPPFIMALVLLSVFYAALHWFPPERLSTANSQIILSPAWRSYTGLVTLDGLLNGRLDISLDAFRHLVLPVFTLSLLHWATLGRVTRSSMIEELHKEYLLAGRARGIPEQSLVWRHAFRNALAPSLASSALSAASLFTGVFVVEVIFNFKGVSQLIVGGLSGVPDAPAALGFCLYSVLIVMAVMILLDIIQVLSDPRLRKGNITS